MDPVALRAFLRRLAANEGGATATEYILLTAVVTAVLFGFFLLVPMFRQGFETLLQRIIRIDP